MKYCDHCGSAYGVESGLCITCATTGREDGFILRNDPPAHKPARFDNQAASSQRKLISGLDCLPGQGDLFDA
jgi:hypothetical protein